MTTHNGHSDLTPAQLQELEDFIRKSEIPEAEQEAPRARAISAKELLAKHFEPIRWAVPDLIPEGLTILAGRPKLGKSWLCLDLAIAIASGGYVLGKIKVDQGSVLYLALEDNQRRLQSRLRKLLRGGPVPNGLEFIATDANFPKLHEGGVEAIGQWLDDHPDARLIIIDTLAKVRPPQRPGSIYEQDYNSLQGLFQLASNRGIALLVVHHTRKGYAEDAMEEISGSFGLSGGADGMIVLRRDRAAVEAVLVVTGRDVEDQELALNWDVTATQWNIVGDADEYRVSKERKAILSTIASYPEGVSPKELARQMQKNESTTRVLLSQMVQAGQVQRLDNGRYTVKVIYSA